MSRCRWVYDKDEGEFTERSWEQLRATLKEIDNG